MTYLQSSNLKRYHSKLLKTLNLLLKRTLFICYFVCLLFCLSSQATGSLVYWFTCPLTMLLCLSFILSIFASNLLTCLLVHLSTYPVTLSFYYLVYLRKQLVNLSTRSLVYLPCYFVFYLSCPHPEKTLHSHIQITLKSIQKPTSRATLQPTENQIVIKL